MQVAPEVHLPPNSKIASSMPDQSKTEAPKLKEKNMNYSLQQVSADKGPFLKVSSIHNRHNSGQMAVAVQSTQGSRKHVAMKPGTVVFTSISDNMSCDRIYPLPDENFLIRRGGNGQIFPGNVGVLDVAIKKTAYRSKEHAVITKVKHLNIIPLLAFMWGEENPAHPRRYFCYHIMPKMSGKCVSY